MDVAALTQTEYQVVSQYSVMKHARLSAKTETPCDERKSGTLLPFKLEGG